MIKGETHPANDANVERAAKLRPRPKADSGEQRVKKRPRTRSGRDANGRYLVRVRRRPAIEKARQQLPVTGYEQQIIEAVRNHNVVIITGATGSGKTTQVPQFLFEEGFGDARSLCSPGMVAVTQPRRIAAITCAGRVAEELGTALGKEVGYHIRHDANVMASTKVKFCTDGILLREVENDFLLKKYSAVIIDEIHERTYDTDLLLAFLSRIVEVRASHSEMTPLKVILMSATLDRDSVRLFPGSPTITVPARQFSVATHFSRQTEMDYISAAFEKVSKIHKQLPKGDVLVFLTGRMEVDHLCRRLSEEFGALKGEGGMRIYPLYSTLSESLQKRVFQESAPLEIRRKVIVSTNIAETSITIPGVRYVVDSGRVKRKVFKSNGLIVAYEVGFISQASAAQRAGRAGRTGPGHCYRLFSSAVMQEMLDFDAPEILQKPADEIVLRLRALGIRKVADFPFPTRPDANQISKAEHLLSTLGALSNSDKHFLGVTKIGRYLSRFPLPPRYALLLHRCSTVSGALPYATRIASLLATGSPFSKSSASAREKQKVFSHPSCELLSQLRALCAAEYSAYAAGSIDTALLRSACSDFHLHLKTVKEILRTTKQLEGIVSNISRDYTLADADESGMWNDEGAKTQLPSPPSQDQERELMIALLAAFPDQIARRLSRQEALSAGVPQHLRNIAFSASTHSEPVYLDSRAGIILESSTVYVTYTSLLRTKEKIIMQNITIVKPEWIAAACPSLCEFSKAKGVYTMAKCRYCPKSDSMHLAVEAMYTPMSWCLGEVEVDAADYTVMAGDSRFWVFAAAVLQGKAVKRFGSFKGMLVDGSEMLKSGRGGLRALEFVRTLKEGNCDSRKGLLKAWKEDPWFLKDAYLLWVESTHQKDVEQKWPLLVTEELDVNSQNET